MTSRCVHGLAGVAAFAAVACSSGSRPAIDVGTAPTPVVPQAVCTTVVDQIQMDLDSAGPRLIIDVDTAGPVEVEVYRAGEMMAAGTSPHLVLDVSFDTTYDVRARLGGGCPWSRWFHKTVGPANACASCAEPPKPPPPPPPPPAPVTVCTTRPFFIASGAPAEATETVTVAIAQGSYEVAVRTTDPNHRDGYQPEQTAEQVTLIALLANGSSVTIGTTGDIPTPDTSTITRFVTTFPVAVTHLEVRHAGYPQAIPQSIYSVCATFTSR